MWGVLVPLSTIITIAVSERGSGSIGPPAIDWGQWWTYDGISGPRFWGVVNPAWGMCREGRRQSPINLDPAKLLFDPNLTPFSFDKVTVGGVLLNTGHSVEWRASRMSALVNVTGGPLSYIYTLTHARLHFGQRDQLGSEHLVDNKAFPGEVGERMTPELRVMLEGLNTITYGGSSVTAPSLVLSGLLPSTEHYLTYDGSLTQPACHETVTWIIPNKPLYINGAMLHQLRGLRQGNSSSLAHAPLANNFRPVHITHHTTIRTNIHFTSTPQGERCRVGRPQLLYKAAHGLNSG